MRVVFCVLMAALTKGRIDSEEVPWESEIVSSRPFSLSRPSK